MSDTPNMPTPAQRLALSRAALLAELGYERIDPLDAGPAALDEATLRPVQPLAPTPQRTQGPVGALGTRLRGSLLGRWWQRSDLRHVPELVLPAVESYARVHPTRLVLYAAAAGSLAVLVKPWRMVTAGAVVGLLLKSTHLGALALDLLADRRDGDRP